MGLAAMEASSSLANRSSLDACPNYWRADCPDREVTPHTVRVRDAASARGARTARYDVR